MFEKTVLAAASPATQNREAVQQPRGKILFHGQGPKTQSIEAVKALLSWRGRAVDPMPSRIEFMNHGDNSRLMLILSSKKDGYYTVTPRACSCPAAIYNPGKACKHQKKYFPVADECDSIRPDGKWAGGYNGPVAPEEMGVA